MRVVRVDVNHPDRAVLDEAAELLRAGSLVAFPTETVYGLGAHALDARAVQRIYEAKGRPAINPLIVHVASLAAARALAADWPAAADALAAALWPGPITLVVRRTAAIPDVVSAGSDTVGLRVPAHPVALALLRTANIPVAAPSANLSNQISPTTAEHVVRGLGERVPLVLDGGPTDVGIESTVVDVTGSVPTILRPGMVSRDDVARIAGDARVVSTDDIDAPRSPGMMGRHYAPRARVRLFASSERESVRGAAAEAVQRGQRVGAMTFDSLDLPLTLEVLANRNPAAYAQALYANLHAFDDARCDLLFIEEPPADVEWAGVRDRLSRAAR